MVLGKMAVHLCLTLIIKDLKISVEQDKVVTTLNIIKHYISYLVYLSSNVHIPKPPLCNTCIHLEAINTSVRYIVVVLSLVVVLEHSTLIS